jgi:hypothetical protein
MNLGCVRLTTPGVQAACICHSGWVPGGYLILIKVLVAAVKLLHLDT